MKKDIFVKDILKVTNGKLIIGNENIICENFSRDTRAIENGDIYLGIRGEVYDGNSFWKEALDKGASVVIIDEETDISSEELENYKNKAIIKVKDTIKALQEIAKYKRSLYNIPIIGVTGSVGKTSTRDIIASVVAQKYKTLKTIKNHNNNIGLPFTILKLKDHEAAVIEMGMNHLGEISLLSQIAKPTISVITNVGTSHIGNLGSRENILKAKLEILDGMDEKKVIINNDNDLLHQWNETKKSEYNVMTYGIEQDSQIKAKDIREFEGYSKFICENRNEKYEVEVPISGKHFIYNAMCAIAVGQELGIEKEKIIEGIKQTNLTEKRMQIIEINNNITIIDDAYNASYESMKAAIEYLGRESGKRKIAVLGDMFELGEHSEQLHKNVGKEVAKNKIDILICSGEQSKNILEEAVKEGIKKENVYYEISIEEVANRIKNIMKENDEILIKASNAMKFSNIVQQLTKDKK